MDLTQIKLVVTDMDGTLLNSNHEVSSLFLELFEQLKKHHIIFVAASGRPYYGITDKLKAIKSEIIIVAENGGIVVDNENVLLSIPIDKNNLHKIEDLIYSNNHIHPIYCTKSKAYFKNNSNGFIKLLSEYYPNFSVVNTIDEIEEASNNETLEEAFGTGTAVAITMISEIAYKDKIVKVSDDNPVAEAILKIFNEIRTGKMEDKFNWMVKLEKELV